FDTYTRPLATATGSSVLPVNSGVFQSMPPVWASKALTPAETSNTLPRDAATVRLAAPSEQKKSCQMNDPVFPSNAETSPPQEALLDTSTNAALGDCWACPPVNIPPDHWMARVTGPSE